MDWAWPARAAAWIDAACWVVWLVAAGHSPTTAERQAAQLPAWREADAAAIRVFATVQARLWADITNSGGAWTAPVADAAARWKNYRVGLP